MKCLIALLLQIKIDRSLLKRPPNLPRAFVKSRFHLCWWMLLCLTGAIFRCVSQRHCSIFSGPPQMH